MIAGVTRSLYLKSSFTRRILLPPNIKYYLSAKQSGHSSLIRLTVSSINSWWEWRGTSACAILVRKVRFFRSCSGIGFDITVKQYARQISLLSQSKSKVCGSWRTVL